MLVGLEGVEPSRLAAHDPKSCVSASSTKGPLWCPHPVLTRELVITNDLICHLSIGAGVSVLDVGKGVEFLPTPFSREVENPVKSVAIIANLMVPPSVVRSR